MRNALPPILLCGLLAWSAPALAAIIVVDTLDDELNVDGDCSLREAIQSANSNIATDECTRGNSGNGDLIVAWLEGEILLASEVSITEGVTIAGAGPQNLTLRLLDAGLDRHLRVFMTQPTHDFALKELRIAGGGGDGIGLQISQVDSALVENVQFTGHSGVALYADPGGNEPMTRLQLRNVRFEDNARTSLVARTFGTVEIESSVFRSNRSSLYHGGAALISGVASAFVTNSVFERNRSADGLNAGALQVTNGLIADPVEFRLRNTSFAYNRAGSELGDALAFYGPIDGWLTNATFTGNGRAIYAHGPSEIRLRIAHATIEESGHRAYANDDPAINGVVIAEPHHHVEIAGSVLFGGPPDGALCASTGGSVFTSGGFNLLEDGDVSCNPVADDTPTVDPGLLPYADFGGAVPVRLPRAGSDTFNHAGSECFDAEGSLLVEDARGYARPHLPNADCDTGSVEWHPDLDDHLLRSGFDR